MTEISKRTLIKTAGWGVLASAAALAGCGKKEEARLRASGRAGVGRIGLRPPSRTAQVAFIYVGPVGDGGWTFAPRQRPQGGRGSSATGRHHLRREGARAADAERVLRDVASQGNKLIFGTTFGYMEPMMKTAVDLKDVKFEHATGYKTSGEHAHLRQPPTRARTWPASSPGHDQDQHARRRRVDPDPRVIPQHQQLHARRAVGQPEGQDQGRWVNRWFNPPKETEAAQSSDQRRRRRADAEHRLVGGAADCREGRQVRPSAGTATCRPTRPTRTSRRPSSVGPVLRQGGPGRARQQVDHRPELVGRQSAIDIVSISDKVPADERRPKVKAAKAGLKRTAASSSGRARSSARTAKVLKKDEVADDKFLGGVKFYVKGVSRQSARRQVRVGYGVPRAWPESFGTRVLLRDRLRRARYEGRPGSLSVVDAGDR